MLIETSKQVDESNSSGDELITKPTLIPTAVDRDRRRVRLLALIAELGIDGFIGAVVLLHLLRPDLNPSTRTISEYVLGRDGFLMTAAFFALGVGALCLSASITHERVLAHPGRFLPTLLVIFGLGVLACGIFPTDSTVPGAAVTLTGSIHKTAASIAFGSGFSMMLVAAWRFREDRRWRVLSWPSLGIALAGLASFSLLAIAAQPGWAERALVATVVLWQSAVAERARALASR
jgi:hypothetical protein